MYWIELAAKVWVIISILVSSLLVSAGFWWLLRSKKRDEELEQLRVQLAGCLTAAEGCIFTPAVKGDYGWSLAYQRVLDLRRAFDMARTLYAK